ncbi:hypothetical protein N9H60_02350 [Flavimaricola sp.]|nr:hypothetical protein [Flavimaricola sp.]MDA9020000.1 hypothetical protein [Flavimaricola sp.]
MAGSQFDALVQVAGAKALAAERVLADCRTRVQHHAELVGAAQAALAAFDTAYDGRRAALSLKFWGSMQSASSLDDLADAVRALKQERIALEQALTERQREWVAARGAEDEALHALRKLEATKMKREEMAQTEQAAETRARMARAEDDPTW